MNFIRVLKLEALHSILFFNLGYADEEDRRNHQREQEEGNNSNKNRNDISSPGTTSHMGNVEMTSHKGEC